ncbi:hypothetical protein [Rhizobium etli]|uniref:hypothetical protein n=1 Tax=Rhizobium etli TaxID=29449 RepID=UPI000315F094|nr:hypothetical protein [Rhizobium etli]
MATDEILDGLLDELAAIEHERWAHWQRYVHDKGQKRSDGSLLIPAELVARWEKQIETPFALLSDEEKNSDREQVQKYLPLLKAALRE